MVLVKALTLPNTSEQRILGIRDSDCAADVAEFVSKLIRVQIHPDKLDERGAPKLSGFLSTAAEGSTHDSEFVRRRAQDGANYMQDLTRCLKYHFLGKGTWADFVLHILDWKRRQPPRPVASEPTTADPKYQNVLSVAPIDLVGGLQAGPFGMLIGISYASYRQKGRFTLTNLSSVSWCTPEHGSNYDPYAAQGDKKTAIAQRKWLYPIRAWITAKVSLPNHMIRTWGNKPVPFYMRRWINYFCDRFNALSFSCEVVVSTDRLKGCFLDWASLGIAMERNLTEGTETAGLNLSMEQIVFGVLAVGCYSIETHRVLTELLGVPVSVIEGLRLNVGLDDNGDTVLYDVGTPNVGPRAPLPASPKDLEEIQGRLAGCRFDPLLVPPNPSNDPMRHTKMGGLALLGQSFSEMDEWKNATTGVSVIAERIGETVRCGDWRYSTPLNAPNCTYIITHGHQICDFKSVGQAIDEHARANKHLLEQDGRWFAVYPRPWRRCWA